MPAGDANDPVIVYVSSRRKLHAAYTLADPGGASGADIISWAVAGPATVAEQAGGDAVVTFTGAGAVVVTATVGGVSDAFHFTVKAAPVAVQDSVRVIDYGIP